MHIMFPTAPCGLIGAYQSTGGNRCNDNYIASQFKQERQCTYNVTFRRIHVNIAAMEKQEILHILSVCL